MSHFTPETDPPLFRCPCGRPECDAPEPSTLLLARLNLTRDFYGAPMLVTSGVRCRVHNAAVGGEHPSEHLDGDAADIACTRSRDRFRLASAALKGGFVRVGVGATFVHLGVSAKAATFPSEVMWIYPAKAAAPAAAR